MENAANVCTQGSTSVCNIYQLSRSQKTNWLNIHFLVNFRYIHLKPFKQNYLKISAPQIGKQLGKRQNLVFDIRAVANSICLLALAVAP